MSRFARKSDVRRSGPDSTVTPEDPILTIKTPGVWEYLTINRYDSGEPRLTSTLMVVVEDGKVKCCLNDREQSRSLWVAADSLEGALLVLESLLDDDRAIWRVYQPMGGRGKRRS